ncbi:MAG TPA: response regulator [Burkholderiaceae bacterium]
MPQECGEAEAIPPAEVFIVDDDPAVCTALRRLLGLQGYRVSTFHSAEAFLARHDPHAYGCIVLDVALPGLNGLALQQVLEQRGNQMPILFLTGAADVPMCAQAMKRGAIDFLTKPVDDEVLFAAVAGALQREAELSHERAQRDAAASRLATLTAREREVLAHVIAGRLNKQIAADLGTAEKTVKVHRARGMEKMHVRSVAELVRMVERSHLEVPRGSG